MHRPQLSLLRDLLKADRREDVGRIQTHEPIKGTVHWQTKSTLMQSYFEKRDYPTICLKLDQSQKTIDNVETESMLNVTMVKSHADLG